MKVRVVMFAAAGVSAAALAGFGHAQTKAAAGPVATYWMTAETSSGLGAMMGRGGAGMAAAMMSGRMGGSVNHVLHLQLGSTRKTSGAPEAEHVPPAGLGAG